LIDAGSIYAEIGVERGNNPDAKVLFLRSHEKGDHTSPWKAEGLSKEDLKMKTITSLVAAAALAAGMAVASAQSSQPPVGGGGGQKEGVSPQEQQRGGASQTNPAPTVGRGGMSSGGAASTTKQDEQAEGVNQSIERNPDGTIGGSKSNPSR